MAKIGRVQEVEIAKIKPYENNAKLHSKQQVQKIADSIREFGFISPCLIDKDMNLIAGHGRMAAAQTLGMTSVPCLSIEGLTEEQKRAYILADNKLTEMGGWDTDLVSKELEELKELGFDINLTGFSIDDIIIDEEMGADKEEDIEEMAERAKPRIQRGEIWQLGDHRLMCGDSTSTEDVQTLMGGELADLLLTDPPYNVDIGGKTEMLANAGITHNVHGIENDAMDDDDFREFLGKAFSNAESVMREGASFYVWYASVNAEIFLEAIRENGLRTAQQLIWVKDHLTLGRSDYQWRHEPCLYGWKEGAAHYFIDLRSLTTIFDNPNELSHEELKIFYKQFLDFTTTLNEKKPRKSELHPTMKPIPLIAKQVRNSTRENENVLDLFGGSGTTLLACEAMNRKCYMMEYDPKYAEVIIHRWEEETGKTANRIKEP